MKSKLSLRLILMAVVTLAVVVALLVWTFTGRHKESGSEREAEHAEKAKSRESTVESEPLISLEKEMQIKSGIVVSPLAPVSHQEEIKAYGSVLELQNLVDLRKNLFDLRKNLVNLNNNLAVAKAQGEKTQVSLDTSRKQYERLKLLYEDDQNVSARAFQSAETAWRSDEANTRAAEEALRTAQEAIRVEEGNLQVLEDTARQQWGDIFANWLFKGSQTFERLIQRQDVLIQVTLPSGVNISSAPQNGRVQTAGGKLTPIRLISPSPRTDPRIQGMSFFYLAPAQMGLLPGMSLLAYLPTGSLVKGVIVPASAIVWWQGKAWAFIQKGDEQFFRREVPTETPVKDGWFVVKELRAGERLVTGGAQSLLSEEFRSQIKVGEEGEEGEEAEKGEKEEKHK